MAKSKNNVVTHGLSGKVGDMLVFRQRRGKTIVAAVPRERTGEPSAKQKAQLAKFQEAVIYATSALADPVIRKRYEEEAKSNPDRDLSAYNIAVADFFRAPQIEEVDLSAYTGKTGDTIRIRVTDDFEVKAVTVRIENADATLVEQGMATNGGRFWNYTATKNNTSLDGDKIIIRATDNPDNVSEMTKNL